MTVYIPAKNFILHIGKVGSVEMCGVDDSRLVVSWARYTVYRSPAPPLWLKIPYSSSLTSPRRIGSMLDDLCILWHVHTSLTLYCTVHLTTLSAVFRIPTPTSY
jgi:hypothetical protein